MPSSFNQTSLLCRLRAAPSMNLVRLVALHVCGWWGGWGEGGTGLHHLLLPPGGQGAAAPQPQENRILTLGKVACSALEGRPPHVGPR